ncbi:MAG: pyridoxal-phosphate dependent enzyme, partial [Clostridia bacterium]|nr:pyridoxal-phosphate dependent enzyme [Clostridia bacterium]
MTHKINDAKALFDALPRAPLGFFPTPLQRLDRLSDKLGIELYIKRDDFTGMNLFGGNKVRKLEYLLGGALATGATHAITYGATQSNHAMETAAACRRAGLMPILYLTAVVPPDGHSLRANLLLDHILGAEIHIVPIEPGETEADAEARSFRM